MITPKAVGDKAILNSRVISGANMKGVHDAQFVTVGDRAYVVYEANDVQASENPHWDYIYCAMSVVDINTGELIKVLKISESEQKFANATLQKGCTFVPRIVKISERTLRVIFTSEAPSVRPSQAYYTDFDIESGEFDGKIYPFTLKTALGEGDFNNKNLQSAALAAGVPIRDINEQFLDCCTFVFDIFKQDGDTMAIVNAFWTGINALAKFKPDFTGVELIGFIGEHSDQFKTTESGAVKAPSGKWLAILREETKWNYMLAESNDGGATWSRAHYSPLIENGVNSKPVLRRLGERYYLGYNYSSTGKPSTDRSNFVLLSSSDCENWTEYAVFNSPSTFQYPTFEYVDGKIYFTASVGNKEQIVFGKL